MRTVIIIQARTGSTRLPNKVLLPLGDKNILQNVLQRAKKVTGVDEVILATTTQESDNILEKEARDANVSLYKGSQNDVLDRYYQAALKYKADHIIRITSDCPLIDPALISRLLKFYIELKVDYAHPAGFPRGLDAEVFSFKALEECKLNATRTYEKEHVTPYIYENKDKFNIFTMKSLEDYSSYRWTVDVIEDYNVVKEIYKHLGSHAEMDWMKILDIVQGVPSISQMNKHVLQKKLGE